MDSFKKAHEKALHDAETDGFEEDKIELYLSAMEAQGYKLVGPVPTPTMMLAGNKANHPDDAWAAMIAAAPTVEERLK